MKKRYESPELEVVILQTEQIMDQSIAPDSTLTSDGWDDEPMGGDEGRGIFDYPTEEAYWFDQ